RAGGRRLPGPPHGPHGDRGGKLLLSHAEVPGAPARAVRGGARAHHAGRLPSRGALVAARADRGPLHLATEDPARLGHRPALRRPLRDLRLVRRATQLRERRRVGGSTRALAARAPSHRQGHREDARHLLADHADGRGASALPRSPCPRLLDEGWPEDVEDHRQRGPAARHAGALRRGGGAALPSARRWGRAGRVTRLNADLANGLGNLASRVLAMQQRYFAGAVQPLAAEPVDLALREAFATARREVDEHVAQLAFHRGLESIWRGLDHANKY